MLALTRPTVLGGAAIDTGERVFLHFGSANLDRAHFPDPERFDPARPPRHVAFGRGPHACIGAALARVEALEAFVLIFRRWPELRRAGASWPAPHLIVNVLDGLPVHPRP